MALDEELIKTKKTVISAQRLSSIRIVPCHADSRKLSAQMRSPTAGHHEATST
jgi:hypothetical protein